ncbi:DUF885 domain-containing protein [Robiginitalea sp. M366]|uniref:DUF885 domain-containing protein n=1 Tax=Robiginitalea aestuariiviva TaxID=3036903 RepID=UPI00240E644F|nr:DUF885 domain-containing protein [Robiginitalea aestuariiviva]MDG1573377.1 DUF885 domain-containing protein [Robiginitalea aestuariiviva]
MKKFVFAFCALAAFWSPAQDMGAKTALDTVMAQWEAYQPYDWKEYPLGLHTEARYRDHARFAETLLQELEPYSGEGLGETDRISLELLRFVLQDRVDQYHYGMHLNPIQADQGFHLSLNYRIRPLNSYRDARNYLQLLAALPEYAQQHFTLMREGLKRGVAQPKAMFRGYESTYNDHIVEDFRESPFYKPFLDLPASMTATQKDSVLQAAQTAIAAYVVPTFRNIKTFFETEYLPVARTEIGVSATPGGAEFYQNRIDFYTTSKAYTAQDIHEIGLKEVARIQAQMQEIIDTLGYQGSFAEFLEFLRTDPQFYVETPQALLMHARDIAKRIDGQLPRFFKRLPRRPYGVEPVPAAIAPKYTGGRYVPPASETRAGTYLVNTYKLDSRPLYTLPALTAHEAVPGHHLQGALNRELSDSIPGFRRRLYLSAYGEGWGLYSEYLAADMGIYTTPYERFGQLTYEMWRACRLVVDTGIHALGWSRDRAVAFMRDHTALSLHEINTETDRYIAWPGQALSYKMGEITLRELRARAEKALGADFDIREFHRLVLEQGTVTLPILRRRIDAYIASQTQP